MQSRWRDHRKAFQITHPQSILTCTTACLSTLKISEKGAPSESLARRSVSGHRSLAHARVSPSTAMLRILIVLLASSDALAIMPSSKPALQPVSMHTRIQTLLHSPSRSALADVLHGPYPPDAPPAYLRAVHVLIVAGICWLHIAYMRLPEWLGQPIASCLKDLTTRCSLHFCKMHGLDCEHACKTVGTLFPSAFIATFIMHAIASLVFHLVMIWIDVGS